MPLHALTRNMPEIRMASGNHVGVFEETEGTFGEKARSADAGLDRRKEAKTDWTEHAQISYRA